MDIDDLTIKQARDIARMFGGSKAQAETGSIHIGKKCVIRTYASGVHFGTVVASSGRTVELANARRLWRWDVAPHGVSLSEVANHGPVGTRSKICETVACITILDALEIIPALDAAVSVIESADVYKPEP